VKRYFFSKKREPAGASPSAVDAVLKPGKVDSKPSPDEVARKAYFSYVNQGSPQGHEVQHWLKAEAELIKERNLAKVYLFRNWT